jgi:exodeoxyribonuclease V alpha subunit
MSQVVEVNGIILSISSFSNPTVFKIYCPNMKKSFDAVSQNFCPIRVNDNICAICFIDSDQKLNLIKPPFVQPPLDRESTIQCLIKVLKKGHSVISKFYNKVSKMAGGDEMVISYISETSQSWEDKHDMELLYKFDGMDPDDIKRLLNWWHKEQNLRRLYLLGLNKKEINGCRMKCEEIYQSCKNNVFTLPAISLEKCDDINDRLGKTFNEDDKLRGGIVRIIWKNLHELGWTGSQIKYLSKQFPNLKDHIDILIKDYRVVVDLDTAYLKFPFKVETFVADFIIDKITEDFVTYDMPLDEVIKLKDGREIIRDSASFTGTKKLSEEQKKAIQGALDHNFSIITGAGGVGKTSVLVELVHNLELREIPYALTSFTGKATSRIREVTKKRSPSTMHRLIANTRRIKEDRRSNQFEKDIPLREYEHIIIDEVSMVTTELFYDLIIAYPNVNKITLVGDVNQLQPIGWGSLFKEIMISKTVPTYKLTTNYRSTTKKGNVDGIILNATAIISHDNSCPFEFIETENFTIIEGPEERVYDIIKEHFDKGIPVEKLVILSPFNKSLETLNKTFQQIYNGNSESIQDSRGVKWAVGDRVMLTENDSSIGVFNGETGIIKEVSEKDVTVQFENTSSGCHSFDLEPNQDRINYSEGTSESYFKRGKEMDNVLDGDEGSDLEKTVKKLTHAYALTVDKSQGSEFDNVIFYIPEFNCGSFLNKNRIYTGITRAKCNIWCVVTDIQAFNESAVKSPPYRCENLAKRLSKLEQFDMND